MRNRSWVGYFDLMGNKKDDGDSWFVLGYLALVGIVVIYCLILGMKSGSIMLTAGGVLGLILLTAMGAIVIKRDKIRRKEQDVNLMNLLENPLNLEQENHNVISKVEDIENTDRRSIVADVGEIKVVSVQRSDEALPKIKSSCLPKSSQEYEVIYTLFYNIAGNTDFPKLDEFKRDFLREPIKLDFDLKTLRNFYDCYLGVYQIRLNQRDFLAYFPKIMDGIPFTTKEFQQYGKNVKSEYFEEFDNMTEQLREVLKRKKER